VKVYDLYGSCSVPLEELRDAVESMLGVEFSPHRSDYVGDYYKTAGFVGETIAIQPNYLDGGDEDEVLEPAFADRPVLLYVNETDRGDEIRGLLAGIAGLDFLRRKTL
jgi:hypothetical protein